MHNAARASHDASGRMDIVQGGDEVFWLRPRTVASLSSHRGGLAPRSLRRLGASLSVGIALNLSMAGIAFAPSAQALEDDALPVSTETSAPGTTALGTPAPETIPIIRVNEAPDFDDAPEPPNTTATVEISTGLECDESEIAERHRNDVRRLLAEGLRTPNEPVEFGGVKISRRLVETILRASEATGVDPVYMMALADKESSFSVDVKASTSSAEGLFQFIARTWLDVVREFGPRHGLHAEAAAIELSEGEPKVADEVMRERILGLRRDPYFSAVMAAELLKKDRASIEQRIGRELRHTEFYLAHFFGVDAAGRFMKLLDGKPKQSAPRVFPQAAKANKPLFFARKGKKTKDLSVAEVYAKIDRMIDARIGRYRAVTSLASPASVQPSI
jgi:Transglycosylase SLT domain